MNSIEESIKIDRASALKVGDDNVDFLITPDGDAWLTLDSIIKIIGRGSTYTFKSQFRQSFDTKVTANYDSKQIKKTLLHGESQRIYHESILYKSMMVASQQEGFNNEEVNKLLDFIFVEVLPSIRKHGQYPPPQNKAMIPSSWEVVSQIAQQMSHIANLGIEHENRLNKLEWKTSVMDEEALRDKDEIERLKDGQEILKGHLYEILGSPNNRTVRLRMQELGLSRKSIELHKMEVGQLCKKMCEQSNIQLPEKLVEGKYNVNQYPIDIIDRALTMLKLI
jgi:prophage antirepressor-like protein